MKLTVEFPEGPSEVSEAFYVVYENQFGVVCFAWQDARKSAEALAPTPLVQEIFADAPTTDEWPDGAGAGVLLD